MVSVGVSSTVWERARGAGRFCVEVFSSMIPAAFKYASAATVQEAIDLLQQPDAKVLAGGHSLLPLMKLRLANPPILVDINRIVGLDYIREDPRLRRLQVGALVRHVDMERSPLIRSSYPLLHDAAQGIGDPQVRNRGTLAGSIAHADPASDWPAALLAYDGEVVATGPNGERVIRAREFYVDILTTILQPDELVTEVRFPMPPPGTGGAYEKLERKVGDYAVVGVAALVTVDGDVVTSAGLGLCNAASVPIKASTAEAFLLGKPAAPDNMNEAARLAMEASDPVEDDRGPVDYKRAMVRELTRRALRRAPSTAHREEQQRERRTAIDLYRDAPRQRQRIHRRRRGPTPAGPLHPREPGPHRHPHRVRYLELRRLHGAAQRPGHQILHDADHSG